MNKILLLFFCLLISFSECSIWDISSFHTNEPYFTQGGFGTGSSGEAGVIVGVLTSSAAVVVLVIFVLGCCCLTWTCFVGIIGLIYYKKTFFCKILFSIFHCNCCRYGKDPQKERLLSSDRNPLVSQHSTSTIGSLLVDPDTPISFDLNVFKEESEDKEEIDESIPSLEVSSQFELLEEDDIETIWKFSFSKKSKFYFNEMKISRKFCLLYFSEEENFAEYSQVPEFLNIGRSEKKEGKLMDYRAMNYSKSRNMDCFEFLSIPNDIVDSETNKERNELFLECIFSMHLTSIGFLFHKDVEDVINFLKKFEVQRNVILIHFIEDNDIEKMRLLFRELDEKNDNYGFQELGDIFILNQNKPVEIQHYCVGKETKDFNDSVFRNIFKKMSLSNCICLNEIPIHENINYYLVDFLKGNTTNVFETEFDKDLNLHFLSPERNGVKIGYC